MTTELSGQMPCPVCSTTTSTVVDTRRAGKRGYGPGIRRRRECANGHRFTTIEKVVEERARRIDRRVRDIATDLSSRIDEVMRA